VPTTNMRREIDEIPEAVARFLAGSTAEVSEAAAALRASDPLVVTTIARGSSDHASNYLKYVIELTLGLPVASIGPSVASIYGRKLRLERAAALAISQSGKSPDIVSAAQLAREGGATVIALTNTANSPLADAANWTIDLLAGPEKSVAATKSFVSSVVAGLALVAAWSENADLQRALINLPEVLGRSLECDWSELVEALDGHSSLYVLGRGPGMAIASEAALKFKETCGMHAEAYSSAEVAHGPKAIVTNGYPVLALAARDRSEASVIESADRLGEQGAQVFVTAERPGRSRALPFAASGHNLTDALSLVVSFYGFAETLARHRGLDPDQPPHLKKVTETV